MLEFTLKRDKKGKRSRWSRKFPRKKIIHRGDEKSTEWYANNWLDDSYPYWKGSVEKFLRSNLGRPVDKVFSEFLERCRKNLRKYNLRKEFYDYFEFKENISYSGGFYLSNGIINYKKPCKRKRTEKSVFKYSSYAEISHLNQSLLPNNSTINRLVDEAASTGLPVTFGFFYIYRRHLGYRVTKVSLVDTTNYNSFDTIFCNIEGVGNGFNLVDLGKPTLLNTPMYYDEFSNPRYKFVIKI